MIEHYLASDGVIIRANIVYKKINNSIIVGSYFGYEGHNDFSDSIFLIKKNKLKIDFDIFSFEKNLHKTINKLENFRIKFENKKNIGHLSNLGKKLKKSDDTEIFDNQWEYGTEDFDLKILSKLSRKWSLLIKWN